MALTLRFLAGMAGVNARDFAAGWYEGLVRAKGSLASDIIPASMYDRGTVAFAASQAAVAFKIGLDER